MVGAVPKLRIALARRAGVRDRVRAALATGALVAGLGLAAACSPRAGAAPLPPRPATVDVAMREFAFENPPVVARGRAVFRVHNAGSMVHELILVALPPDTLPIAEQLRSDSRVGVETLVTFRNRAPGSDGAFASDLSPGRYAFICFITEPDGTSHADKGMSSEFRVS